jgi:hypothetical protein
MAESKADRSVRYVAFDIEKFGARFFDPVVAIGYCIGTPDGDILDSGIFCMKHHVSEMEPRCKEQFWDKQPEESMKRLFARMKPAKEEWNRFRDWFENLPTKYKDHELVLLSDHPSFDIAAISAGLTEYTGRNYPINYMGREGHEQLTYCSVQDPSERLEMLSEIKQAFIKGVLHAKGYDMTHWAEDDAKYIFQLQCSVDRAKVDEERAKLLADYRQSVLSTTPMRSSCPSAEYCPETTTDDQMDEAMKMFTDAPPMMPRKPCRHGHIGPFRLMQTTGSLHPSVLFEGSEAPPGYTGPFKLINGVPWIAPPRKLCPRHAAMQQERANNSDAVPHLSIPRLLRLPTGDAPAPPPPPPPPGTTDDDDVNINKN